MPGLFQKFLHADDPGRLCSETNGICANRSTMSPSGKAVSNPHMCNDFIEPHEETHGRSQDNQHHCVACKTTWYRRK